MPVATTALPTVLFQLPGSSWRHSASTLCDFARHTPSAVMSS